MSIFSQNRNPPLSSVNASISPKTEGTTQTFGQFLSVEPLSVKTETVKQTRSSKDGSLKSFIPSAGSVESLPKDINVVPEDTVVEVVQDTRDVAESVNELGDISGLPCSVKSNIFVTAASSGKKASVVKPKKNLVDSEQTNLFGSILGSVVDVAANVSEIAIVAGSSVKPKEEVKKILSEAQKVDLNISLKSKKSEPVPFNSLKVPELNVDFVYNFFDEREGDIRTQEDPSKDPLFHNRPIDVPRYVELKWDSLKVTEPISESKKESEKNREKKRKLLGGNRGMFSKSNSGFKNSVNSKKKKDSPITKDGVDLKIVDIHEPEKAFESINNNTVFSNTISLTINTKDQPGSISSLPIIGIEND